MVLVTEAVMERKRRIAHLGLAALVLASLQACTEREREIGFNEAHQGPGVDTHSAPNAGDQQATDELGATTPRGGGMGTIQTPPVIQPGSEPGPAKDPALTGPVVEEKKPIIKEIKPAPGTHHARAENAGGTGGTEGGTVGSYGGPRRGVPAR
jgi:hypothetical protein